MFTLKICNILSVLFFTLMLPIQAIATEKVQIKPVPGAEVFNFNRIVASGSRYRLQFAAAVNTDCAPLHAFAKVIRHPMHGTVEIKSGMDLAFWPAGNVREKCAVTKVSGIEIYYNPDKNYVGDDNAEVLITLSNAYISQFVFRIEVF